MDRLSPETERRIAQFKARGGMEYAPDDVALQALVHIGTAEHNHAIFTFRCLLCGRVERNNQDMGPMCTGPNWTNEHPPEIMDRVVT